MKVFCFFAATVVHDKGAIFDRMNLIVRRTCMCVSGRLRPSVFRSPVPHSLHPLHTISLSPAQFVITDTNVHWSQCYNECADIGFTFACIENFAQNDLAYNVCVC